MTHAFAFNLGIGKQNKKNGSQRKMMSSKKTMIINSNKAQIVMIGIDSEQIIPSSIPEPLLHGPPSGTDKSLCSGHGNTDKTKSPSDSPFTRSICPHSMSEIMKAVFLSNFRKPAGEVSSGSAMRI